MNIGLNKFVFLRKYVHILLFIFRICDLCTVHDFMFRENKNFTYPNSLKIIIFKRLAITLNLVRWNLTDMY